MNESLRLDRVSKTFPSARGREAVEAVRDVSLALSPGESLGIIGPSGCGKTTLTRLILGQLKPDSGTVAVQGRIGFVPQDPYASLDPTMTVERIVAEPLRFSCRARRWKDCETAVRRAMADVRLDYNVYGKRLPSALSGGERQRVAIARAMVLEPELLILDEPTSMLDQAVKEEIGRLLADLATDRQRSFLMVTHDILLAADICQQLVVMEHGTILEEGPAHEILQLPQTELAHRLVMAATNLRQYWLKMQTTGKYIPMYSSRATK